MYAQAFPIIRHHDLTFNEGQTLTLGAQPFMKQIPLTGLPARVMGLFAGVVAWGVTVTGQVIRTGALGSTAIPFDRLYQTIVSFFAGRSSGNLIGEFIQPGKITGAVAALAAFLANGYSWPNFVRPDIPAAAGTYGFRLDYLIPDSLANADTRTGHHFGRPAASYEGGIIDVHFQTTAAIAALGGIPGSASFANLQVRPWVKLFPSNQPWVGTPWQPKVYNFPVSANGQLNIQAFGGQASFLGTEPSSGLMHAMLLCNVLGLGGAFAGHALDPAFGGKVSSIPWTDQNPVFDTSDLILEAIMLAARGRPTGADEGFGGFPDAVGWPYQLIDGTNPLPSTVVAGVGTSNGSLCTDDLIGLPLVNIPAQKLQTSKLSRIGSNQQIIATIPGATGDHALFTMEAFRYTPTALAEWRKWWTDKMGVPANWEFATKTARKQNPEEMLDEKTAFFPMVLVPPSSPSGPAVPQGV